MGQISYGTITITDTGDVENIYVEYIKTNSSTSAPSQSDSGWSTNTPTWENGKYIWSRTATKYTGIVTPVYSSPVCITGGKGETGGKGDTGTAVSSITPLQYLHTSESSSPGKPTSTVTSTSTAAGQWTKAQPTWASGKYMWTCTEVKYSNNTYAWTDPICANSMNKANSDAANAVSTANNAANTASAAAANASNALTTAQNAQTALNNYKGTNDTAVQALQSRASHFWWDSAGAHVASGTGTMSSNNVTENDPSTHGFNALMAPGALSLRENAVNLMQLATNALTFYIAPNGGSQGPKALEVGTSGMKIFNPVSSNNIALMELSSGAISFKDLSGNVQATFGNNGAIQSGNYSRGSAGTKFAAGGTKIDLINGEILTKYFRLSQGVESSVPAGAYIYGTVEAIDGKIGSNTNNYWYIGNYTDYNQNQSAAIKSYGSAFIQLGNSSTWRLATNRIHGAWNDDGGGTSGLLHYPDYNNKYWDSGLHLPTSLTDKFLYIRNAPNTEDLENLQNDLDDLGYNYWTYRFYVAGDGSVYARNIYVLDDNGNITPIGGADGVYLLKSGGTMTGSITMSNGGKFIGNLQGTADNASKVNNHTVNSDVPSGAIFTDKNVQTTQANTTKLYITGTATSGTNTGTLSYDSNVYLNTTAGDLRATTFNGYTLAAASAKGVVTSLDTSANLPTSNAVKTALNGYLPLTGGQVTGPTSFGDSVSIDDLTAGNLIVNGAASFTNNLQVNTINGVEVGASPKFTDTVTTVTVTGNGNAITSASASGGAVTLTKGATFLTSYTETDPVFKASAAYGISSTDISNWNSKTSNTGTVTSVRVQASSPLQSSQSTAQSSTLNTTISFANQNKNLVLAGPSTGNATAPTFRSLVADDIPGLAWSKITSGKPTTLSGYGITDAVPNSRKIAGHALSADITLSNSDVGLDNVINVKQITNITNEFKDGQNTGKLVIWRGESDSEVLEVQITAREATSATNATNAQYATYDASEASKTTKTTIADKYIPKSIGTAAGDIIYWSSNGTPTRLAKGSNGQVLKLANGVPTWGTDNNDNTTYSLSGSLSSHKFTTTLTPSSGNATTSAFTLAAGSNISLTDSGTTITIAATDVKVTQTNTTGNADYRLLFSENANDATSTETARKSTLLKFNPSTGLLKTYGISSASGSTAVIYSDVSSAEIKAADSSLTTNSSDSDWLKALLIALCNKYPGKNGYIFKGTMTPNSVGWYEVRIYSTSAKDSTTGLPEYSFGRFLKYINNYELFGTESYSYSYRTVDTNTWNPLTTSQAGYVSTAPNDTAKFLRGDATWAQVSSANLSDIRLTWSSSVSTTDWILAHDTAATGTPLFRAMSPANLKTTMSLNNVENKSSATIRGELTSSNVTTALGYTPVNKAGDSTTGGLAINASNSYSSYNEGLRINAGARTYATLTIGGTNNSTQGITDGAFWIGVYNIPFYTRRLMIAHNGSTATDTYFYSNAAGTVSPWLHLGNSGTITSGNADAVTGGVVYTALSNYVTLNSAQTLTAAATKTYLGLQVYGSSGLALGVTSNSSVTQKAVMKYDANLDAIVFQF